MTSEIEQNGFPDGSDAETPSVTNGSLRDVPPEHIEYLRGMIESFNSSTARLREAYDVLQGKVAALNLQLEETNRELSASLVEKERLSDYLSNILESVSSGVLVIDRDGVITTFNSAAAAMLGLREEDARSKPYRDVFGHVVPDEATPLLTVRTGEPIGQFEKVVISRDGSRIPVGCSVSPLKSSSGELLGAVEVFMDLTRIKALEDELAEKEKLAALGQMAATMAHKIRNPLGGIAGFAGLLDLEVGQSENGRRLVGKITEGVNKLEKIVTTLLAYTAPLTLEKSTYEASRLLEGLPDRAGFTAAAPTYSLEILENVVFDVDREGMRGALAEILKNAREACESGDRVNVTVIGDGDMPVNGDPIVSRLLEKVRVQSRHVVSGMHSGMIVIADNGSGMDADTASRIFDPFFTTRENGIGLGLPGALRIIEKHDGEIHWVAVDGEGSAFCIVLPKSGIR